ncbi:hypothetical protein ACSBR2_043049 [Camellia fascicularis]
MVNRAGQGRKFKKAVAKRGCNSGKKGSDQRRGINIVGGHMKQKGRMGRLGFQRGAIFRASAMAAANSLSISQNQTLRRRSNLVEEAQSTVKVGALLGMQCQGQEEEVVSKIVELEENDLRRIAVEVAVTRSYLVAKKGVKIDSDGSAGGLLYVWKPQVFELQDCCSSKHFIILSGIACSSFPCVIVNIYAPNEVVRRRQIWESLVSIKQHFPLPWCMGGDFNEIRYMSERKGCSRREWGMSDFNEFIEKLELIDMHMLGRQYTWCNAVEGDRWSRIGRFLEDPTWLEKFAIKQWGLSRTILDHCPILLKEDDRDWGPKPFKFINAWRSHPTFGSEVKKRWEDTQVQGWAGYRVMGKLNILRNHLRVWNKEVFGNIDTLLKSAEEELHEWDLKAESRSLTVLEIKRREVRSKVWQLNRNKERFEDRNTRFFHIMASSRQRKNILDSVLVEGVRLENPMLVKQEVKLPFNFLGLPLGANPRRKSTWVPVVEKVKKKLSSWKRKLLSFAARLSLIKSVLSNFPIYFLSLFRMPKGVVKTVVKLQSSFL